MYCYDILLQSLELGSYHDFLDRGLMPTRKLLKEGFLLVK